MAQQYEPVLPRLRRNLATVMETFASHRGISVQSGMKYVVGTTSPQVVFIPGADISARKHDRWMQAYSDAWPDDCEWPADVPRPPKSDGA